MVNRRRLGLAAIVAAAASVIFAGASALAASGSGVTHETNYRGPVRPLHPPAVAVKPGTNNRVSVSAAKTAPAARAAVVGTVTHHFALAASAFAPDGLHHTTDDYINGWNPASLSNTDPSRCFNAALSLPNGITMKSVTVYYTAGPTPMFFAFSQQDLASDFATDLVTFDTPSATTPANTSITKPVPAADAAVNYSKYGYTVGVCPQNNTTFSGLIITYTQPVS